MAKNEIVDPLDGLSKPWQKFFKKFEEIDTIKVSEWKDVHVLAYICQRYEKQYGRKFAVTIKGAPTKSPDMYMVKRIRAMVGTTNMRTIKAYVDWVFDNKIIPKRVVFQKIGFFVTSAFVNEFSFAKKKAAEITRTTEVPGAYKHIGSELGVAINTYGDLAFIQMSVERKEDASSPQFVLLKNLELLGLDLNKLKELK